MAQGITSQSVIKRTSDHVATDMAGEAVVLDMKSGMYYGMDQVGAFIWDLLAEPKSLEQLREAVLESYEIDPETCARDVTAFLEAMQTAGLVEITDETSS